MILVDTSVWIDFFRYSNHSLSEQLTEHLENGTAVALSAVFGELLQGVRSGHEEKIILEFWNNTSKVEEKNLFIEAGKLSSQFNLESSGVGLIDCYMLAAARMSNYRIWTLDKCLLDAYTRLIR